MRELLRSNRLTVTTDAQGRFWIERDGPAQPAQGEASMMCAVVARLAGKRVWRREDVLTAQAVVEELERRAGDGTSVQNQNYSE